jgi:hypothetical protein
MVGITIAKIAVILHAKVATSAERILEASTASKNTSARVAEKTIRRFLRRQQNHQLQKKQLQ